MRKNTNHSRLRFIAYCFINLEIENKKKTYKALIQFVSNKKGPYEGLFYWTYSLNR